MEQHVSWNARGFVVVVHPWRLARTPGCKRLEDDATISVLSSIKRYVTSSPGNESFRAFFRKTKRGFYQY